MLNVVFQFRAVKWVLKKVNVLLTKWYTFSFHNGYIIWPKQRHVNGNDHASQDPHHFSSAR